MVDGRSGSKAGIANPNLRPEHAARRPGPDPLDAAPATTAFSGIDAIAQAIAGMVARTRTPIGDAIALEAIRLKAPARSPVRAYRDGSDAAARSEMALRQPARRPDDEHLRLRRGARSLAQAIGSRTRRAARPHCRARQLVETLEREREIVPEQLERVADALGAPADGERRRRPSGPRGARPARRAGLPVLSSLVGKAATSRS